MRRFKPVLIAVFFLIFACPSFAADPIGNDYVAVYCGTGTGGYIGCVANKDPNATLAATNAHMLCDKTLTSCHSALAATNGMCVSAFKNDALQKTFVVGASTDSLAEDSARSQCYFSDISRSHSCQRLFTLCPQDIVTFASTRPVTQPIAPPIVRSAPPIIPPPVTQRSFTYSLDVAGVRTGISFGIGVIIVLLIYAKRAAFINLIIHSSLPYKLPVYGEDIQCLFKRTQRLNWYGRVLFGIVVNLSMTHQQFIDVRKYWLGRVIAFDSLRRQRQNELARMHLQLAAATKPALKEKTALRQLWAIIKYLLFVIFYLMRAVFSFLFGFLFIRVTIAKLTLGTHIESKDLVLVLQAKEAIEESAKYLKEYLITANTFDGRDEVYDAE